MMMRRERRAAAQDWREVELYHRSWPYDCVQCIQPGPEPFEVSGMVWRCTPRLQAKPTVNEDRSQSTQIASGRAGCQFVFDITAHEDRTRRHTKLCIWVYSYIHPCITSASTSAHPGGTYRLCAAQYSCHRRSTNAGSVCPQHQHMSLTVKNDSPG